MRMFKCTYFPKPYVVPAYIFKPLSTFKTVLLASLGWNVHLFSVFLHRHLHAVSKVSSPHSSLHTEVSWLQNQKLTQFLQPGGPCLLLVCSVSKKMENSKVHAEILWLLTVCLEHCLHLSFKGGGGCQTLTEDLFSFLVILRKGDHEKWRKAGRSFISSTWKYT